MTENRIKWLAAIPYFFVMVIVIDWAIFGLVPSLISLIAYVIYHFVNRDHEQRLIALHTRRAMSIFLKYLIVSIIIAIALVVLGYGMLASSENLVVTGGLVWLLMVVPGLVVTLYGLIASIIGAIRAFRLRMPDGRTRSADLVATQLS